MLGPCCGVVLNGLFQFCNHLAKEERAGSFKVVLSVLCGDPK